MSCKCPSAHRSYNRRAASCDGNNIRDPPVCGCVYDFTGAFIIQHMQGVLAERTVHARIPSSWVSPRTNNSRMSLFQCLDIGRIAPEHLLVNIAAQAHHRKFEKSGHRGRQGISGFALNSTSTRMARPANSSRILRASVSSISIPGWLFRR